MGANVNAYLPGRHAGTTFYHVAKRGLEHMVKLLLFHHVAKRGLEQMVKLLLINGANALVMNDDRQTALDVARVKGYSNVVHAIETKPECDGRKLLELKFVEAPEDQTSAAFSVNSSNEILVSSVRVAEAHNSIILVVDSVGVRSTAPNMAVWEVSKSDKICRTLKAHTD
ncbi:putative E3 ubiquitin-protein ligase XBAT35 isoform X2 [Tanacetum coccineum]